MSQRSKELPPDNKDKKWWIKDKWNLKDVSSALIYMQIHYQDISGAG